MKKIISKILIIFIIAILLIEFSFSNVCNAASLGDEVINAITNLTGGIISIIFWIPKLILTAVVWVFNEVITDNVASVDGVIGPNTPVSPFNIFFNHYKILDVNFFKTDRKGKCTNFSKNERRNS